MSTGLSTECFNCVASFLLGVNGPRKNISTGCM